MSILTLPSSTVVDRVIPKNSFDAYMTGPQKRLLGTQIERIRWTHKLSLDTLNLPGITLKEIQFFEVALRDPEKVPSLLDVIDRAIPYPIVFTLRFGDKISRRVAIKHPNPANEDNAVIDWVITGPWHKDTKAFPIALEKSLDQVFLELCNRIADYPRDHSSCPDLVAYARKRLELEKKILKLNQEMAKAIQFNRKVKLNLTIIETREALRVLD